METSSLLKDPKPVIKVDEAFPPMNGDGLWHDMNLFWRIIKRFKWWFIIVFVLVTAVSFWHYNYYATYTATAKFTITDWSQAYPSSSSIYSPDRVNQLLMLFLSDSVVQFLIKKYNMDAGLMHPDDIREQEKLQSNVASSITLEPSLFNSFNLRVETPDRLRSANMANDIVSKAIEISRGLYSHDLANRIEVLKNLLSTVPAVDSSSGDLLANHFTIIQEQFNKLASNSLSSDQLKIIMSELTALKKQYDDRLIQLKLNELMLKQLSTSGTSSITLIQKAIPDFTNYKVIWFLYSLVIATLICALLPVAIYLLSPNRERTWM